VCVRVHAGVYVSVCLCARAYVHCMCVYVSHKQTYSIHIGLCGGGVYVSACQIHIPKASV